MAFKDRGWLQSAFDTLTRRFYQVGLRKNVRKTVGMVYKPCRAAGVWADEVFSQWMTGEGQSFNEQQRERVI